MSSKSSKLIPTIWPLPGGNDRYLHTLDQIVKWVDSTPAPSRDKFLEWMATEYNAPKSASGYLQLVLKMGVLESQSNGVLVLSNLGQTILEAQGITGKARVVVDRFMQDYLAFREILAVYAQADGSIHLQQVIKPLKRLFPQWTSDAQFEYRATWLLSLTLVRQEKGRSYEITDFGREIAGCILRSPRLI